MQWIVWLQQHWVAPVTVVFAAIWLHAYWPSRRATMEQHGRIPLDDEPASHAT